MAGTFKVLNRADVIEINRRMIDSFGGFFVFEKDNLINPNSLDYILEAIQGQVYNQDMYPAITDKAAAIGWRIIKEHIFFDGNKRTGMQACLSFLEINNCGLIFNKKEVLIITRAIARGKISERNFCSWIESRLKK